MSMYDVASWKTIVRSQSKWKTFSTVVEHTSYYYFPVVTVTFDVVIVVAVTVVVTPNDEH